MRRKQQVPYLVRNRKAQNSRLVLVKIPGLDEFFYSVVKDIG